MKKLMKLLSLVLAIAMLAVVCPAVADDAEEGEDTPTVTTIVPGVLTMGTSADFGPYEFHIMDEDGNDKIVGFDVALAQAIADKLGLTLVIKDMDFNSLVMEVQNGTLDLSLAGFSVEPERAEVIDFSDVYYEGTQAFVVLASNADKYADYAAFAGKPVGAQLGSIQAKLLAENCPDANPVLLANVGDIIMEVLNGTVEGCFMEKVVAESYVKNYPELTILWDVPYESAGSAVVVAKGNTALLDVINAVIAESIESGALAEWVAVANEQNLQAIE